MCSLSWSRNFLKSMLHLGLEILLNVMYCACNSLTITNKSIYMFKNQPILNFVGFNAFLREFDNTNVLKFLPRTILLSNTLMEIIFWEEERRKRASMHLNSKKHCSQY